MINEGMMRENYLIDKEVVQDLSADYPGALLIYEADEDANILFANKDLFALFECEDLVDFMEYTQGTFNNMVHPDDLERVNKSIQEQILAHQNSSYGHLKNADDYVEYRILTKQGKEILVEDEGILVHTEKYGDVFYVWIDSKEVKQAERAFQEFLTGGVYVTSDMTSVDYSTYIIWNLTQNTSYVAQSGIAFIPEDKVDNYTYDDHHRLTMAVLKNNQNLLKMGHYSRDYLLSQFEAGEQVEPLTLNYHIGGKWRSIHSDFDMMRDPSTGDVYLRIQNKNAIHSKIFEKMLSMEYVTITELDVPSETMQAYRLHESTSMEIIDALANGAYSLCRSALRDTMIAEEDRERFDEYTELEYIKERLKEINNYSFTFMTTHGRYVELKIVRADKTMDGDPEKVLIAYAVRDEVTRRRLAADAERERYFELTEAFSEEYNSVYYVELDNDLARPLRLYDQNMNGKIPPDSYKKIYKMAIDMVVAPEYRDEMMLTGEPDYIREVLAHKKSFTTVYQTLQEGVMTFSEKKTVKLDGIDERPTRLIVCYAEREQEIGQRYVAEQMAEEYDYIVFWTIDEDNMRLFRKGEDGKTNIEQDKYSATFERFFQRVEKAYQKDVEELHTQESMQKILADTDRFEYTCKVLDPAKPWMRIVARAVQRDEEGRPETVILSFQGLSDLEAEKLELSEKIREQNRALKIAKAEAEKANEAKSVFLFSMSHDIRTPMNAVLGLADLAKDHLDEKEKLQFYLDEITVAGTQLLNIINRVLEVSRIESNKVEIEDVLTNTDAFFESLVTVFNHQERARDLILEFRNELKYPWSYMDRTHMEEVIVNLVGNAMKYTPDGGKVEVLFESLPGVDDRHFICKTTVRDNGIGMSEEYQSRMFEAFEREETSTISGIQGTGLGLSIVKKLVELMQGTIRVDSTKGVGTCITVEVPHRIGEAPALQNVATEEMFFTGMRVLLAEDIDINAMIAEELLSSRGFEVQRVRNGQECVDAFRSGQPNFYDIILMDIQMPVMNGYEATAQIRALDRPDGASIPILAMTANAFAEDREKVIESGMNDHIAKPIDVDTLFRTISLYTKK